MIVKSTNLIECSHTDYAQLSTLSWSVLLTATCLFLQPAHAQQSAVDKCVDNKIAQFKKEMGEDKTIRVDVLDEWEQQCKRQLSGATRTPPAAAATTATGEVGERLFVAAPKAKPIYVSKGGTRYWPCNGFVAPNLIDVVYRDLSQIARAEGIAPPSNAICHYKISTVNLRGNSITLYSVEFYISKANMDTCLRDDYCSDIRSMTLKANNDTLRRQYFVTNVARKINRMSCLEMSGKTVSEQGGC